MEKKKLNLFLVVLLIVVAVVFYLVYFSAEKSEQLSELQQEIQHLRSKLDQLETLNKKNFVNIQKVPVPLIFCGDTLDIENHFIRERVEREFYSLLGNQGQLQLYIKRTQRYLPMITSHLKAAGLPEDLKYLAVHESALLPKIRSRSNAVGLWQFMYSTGRLYGLKINRYIDERRDPEKATKAAVRFLGDLYKQFDSWPLVLAAYNGGQGRLSRSIKKHNSNSLIDLSLPEETERYYFKIIATKIIVSNAENFGFSLDHDEYFATPEKEEIEFTIHENQMTLEKIASAFNMTIVALKEFNPQLRNTYLPQGTYELNLPVDKYLEYKEQENGEEINGAFSLENPQYPNVDDIGASRLPTSR
jgi:LysM repeat protein